MSTSTPNHAAEIPSPAAPLSLTTRPIPTPGPHDIVLRNHAIAVNQVDWKRQAWGFMIPSYPVVLGCDISGTIHAVGAAVSSFHPGDRVVGYSDSFISGNNDRAAFQTYTLVADDCVTKIPASLDFEHAAMLPMGTATATMALFKNLGFAVPAVNALPLPQKTHEAILIWGGAGSVGSMAVQIAKLLGLKVYATASPHNYAYVKSLGASDVFDYRSPTIVDDIVSAAQKAGIKVKYAIDTVANAETPKVAAEVLLKSGGIGSKLAHTLPLEEGVVLPEGIEALDVHGEQIWEAKTGLALWLFGEFLPSALENKTIVVAPELQVVDGGIWGLQKAMDLLKAGVSSKKLVVKVE